MRQEQIWDTEAAAGYDTPGVGMFAPEVLGPTVDRLVGLAAGGAALEFAIGTGRVAIPLAARGVPVTGIELSQPMVDRLREKVDAAAIPVVLGDMATTSVPGAFSLVYLVFNTISNLQTQAEQVECFRNAARHLIPAAGSSSSCGYPNCVRFRRDVRAWSRSQSQATSVSTTYDVLTQHVVSHHFRFGEGSAAKVFRSPHRYVWPAELDLMAQIAGFELESRHADWSGSEFTAESPSHVSVYRLTG